MSGMMSQQERITGLPPGEYYVIAIDDIEVEDSQDPAMLERLTSSAIRVVLTDDAPIEVPLRRVILRTWCVRSSVESELSASGMDCRMRHDDDKTCVVGCSGCRGGHWGRVER